MTTTNPWLAAAEALIPLALEEDLGRGGPPWLPGDVTGSACVPAGRTGSAWIEARQAGVVCGLPIVREVFGRVAEDAPLEVRCLVDDGATVAAGQRLVELDGSLRAILAGERTALNFLQRLSGVATSAAALVALAGPRLQVLDTRKTTPGWRQLEKLAVRAGGAGNHRLGLHDMYLIKENHIRAAGGLARAVEAARAQRAAAGRPEMALELEVETLDELRQALELGVDWIMLDNFSAEQIAPAVALAAGRARLEVSGGIQGDRLAALARAGVDLVSVGALTHSARAFDCSLLVRENGA
ncbi:MAG: carboxylating nicotinate-nucleotide diphosphorylase [Candidatus Delongbacteria bacterium]